MTDIETLVAAATINLSRDALYVLLLEAKARRSYYVDGNISGSETIVEHLDKVIEKFEAMHNVMIGIDGADSIDISINIKQG